MYQIENSVNIKFKAGFCRVSSYGLWDSSSILDCQIGFARFDTSLQFISHFVEISHLCRSFVICNSYILENWSSSWRIIFQNSTNIQNTIENYLNNSRFAIILCRSAQSDSVYLSIFSDYFYCNHFLWIMQSTPVSTTICPSSDLFIPCPSFLFLMRLICLNFLLKVF